MKKFAASIIAVVTLVALLGSCVSLQDKPITVQERAEFGTVGTATVQFTTFRFLHFMSNNNVKNKAYNRLLAEARKQYGSDVEVRNVQIMGGFSGWELLYAFGAFSVTTAILITIQPDYLDSALSDGLSMGTIFNVLGHIEKITATADVVRRGAAVIAAPAPQVVTGSNYQRLEAAMEKAAATLIDEMPRNAIIAILSVSSNDRDMAAYAMDELEYKLVQARRFQIVDRRQLEQIRAEQNFQLSGDVSDDSAVSIGQMLGASIVITGDISSFGTVMRLSLRAIDVRTARILTIAREQF